MLFVSHQCPFTFSLRDLINSSVSTIVELIEF